LPIVEHGERTVASGAAGPHARIRWSSSSCASWRASDPRMATGGCGPCCAGNNRVQQLPPVNAKRVYRLVKQHHLLLQRYTGSPPMRVHEGTVAVERSDQRYCSDGLEIGCDNGERVRVTFSLDCCDRQAIAFAATTAGISGELVRDVMVQTLLEVPQLPR
jgi:hypothetical protein